VSAVVAISPALDAAAAARGAEELGAMIRQPDIAHVYWPGLSKALGAVCRQLPASDSAAPVNSAVDFILKARDTTMEKDKSLYSVQAQALGELCARLDGARATRTAGAIIATLGDGPTVGDTKLEIFSAGIVAVLAEVANRLEAPGAQRAAEDLVILLRKSKYIATAMKELKAALVALCHRLDASGAAHVAETIVAAVRDKKTSPLVRTVYSGALAALCVRLTPDQAANLERVLVDSLTADLADSKVVDLRGIIGEALGTACGRPGATCAARAAETLGAAIHDPQTPLTAVKPLATALAAVSSQLPPNEASSRANQAVDALDSRWVARTARSDRATVAEALATLWTRLDPTDAVARAKRAAADLEAAVRDPKASPEEIAEIAMALSAVYSHFEPAERCERANAVADIIVAVLRRPRNAWFVIANLSESLAALCAHLNQPGVIRMANAMLAILDDPNTPEFRFYVPTKTFKTIGARLDEHDFQRLLDHPLAAGPLRHALLEIPAGSQKRSFRNTWDYLGRL
jgi:hypothetical protein